jgi:hypothetical protein
MKTCEENIEAKFLFNTARDQNVSPHYIGWYIIHNFFALYSICSQLLQCMHTFTGKAADENKNKNG